MFRQLPAGVVTDHALDELTPVIDGFFALDGGAMFGVVPKPLWERRAPADARNRITLGLRPLLVRAPVIGARSSQSRSV